MLERGKLTDVLRGVCLGRSKFLYCHWIWTSVASEAEPLIHAALFTCRAARLVGSARKELAPPPTDIFCVALFQMMRFSFVPKNFTELNVALVRSINRTTCSLAVRIKPTGVSTLFETLTIIIATQQTWRNITDVNSPWAV